MIALFAEAPALPLHTAGPYVAAAYIVFLLIVLIYVWIMGRKLISNNRELRDLKAQLQAKLEARPPDLEPEVSPATVNQTDNDSHYQIELDEDGAPTGGAGLK
jgi:hypothetical protein